VIELQKLSIVKEKDKYIVGRPETEIYIKVSQLGIEIIEAIQKHKRIGLIQKQLMKRYGKVDVIEFVKSLFDHGFVKKIDKTFINHKRAKKKKLLEFIKPRRVSWMFSQPMYVLYFGIFLLGLVALIMHPEYFPKSKDYFFTQFYIVLFPLTFLISWVFVILHELGHYLAARSLGLSASFGISNRLHYIVATTSVTNLYSLSRHKRFRVLFGGMLVDLIVVALGFLLLFISDTFFIFPPFVYGIIKFIILLQFLGLLWQFMFFMKTDIYYAFEHWIGIYNLMNKTKQYLKSVFWKTFRPHFEKKEEKVVKGYSGFMVIGMLLVAAIFFIYSLPILIELFVTSIGNILRGVVALNFSHFYDKLLFLLIFSINQSLLLYAVIKKHSLIRRPGFYIAILFLFILTNYFAIFFIILLFLLLFSSAFVVYMLTMLLGLASAIVFMNIIRKMHRISNFIVLAI